MSRSYRRGLLAAALLLGGATAFAQELGLDLSENVGLDLTADTREKRPAVAVVGVVPVGALAPEEHRRAERLEAQWMGQLRQGAAFSKLWGPEQAEAERSCTSQECLASYAAKREVDRVLGAQLRRETEGLTLVVHLYDRGLAQLRTETALLTGNSREREKSALALLSKMGEQAAPAMAVLVVRVSPQEATVTLGTESLGQGDVERNVSAGERRLRVAAQDFEPHEETLALSAGETREMEVQLVARPPVPVEQVADADLQQTVEPSSGGFQMPPLLRRPGFYVAAAGGALLAIGAVLGASAKAFESDAVDANKDGVLDVTRSAYAGAQSKAKLANLLMGGGVAALAGGVTWLWLVPSAAPAGSGGGVGVALNAGGSF